MGIHGIGDSLISRQMIRSVAMGKRFFTAMVSLFRPCEKGGGRGKEIFAFTGKVGDDWS